MISGKVFSFSNFSNFWILRNRFWYRLKKLFLINYQYFRNYGTFEPVRKQVDLFDENKTLCIFGNFSKLFFLKKPTTQLYKFVKESFQFKMKNFKIYFWQQTSKINYVGWTFIFQPFNSVFILGQRWWVYQMISPSNRNVFQEKSVILHLEHTFFLFPKMLICPSDIFSSTNVMLLGHVFILKRYFLPAYQLGC